MKKKDLFTIIGIAAVSAVLSVILSNIFINAPENRTAKVEVVQRITDEFPAPNEKYFNSSSINPTQLITIGDGANNNPFNGQ